MGQQRARNAAVPLDQLSMGCYHLSPMIFNMSLGRFRSVVHCMFVVAAS
jgi:hypothetical protein